MNGFSSGVLGTVLSANTLLADTGAQSGGSYYPEFWVSASVAATVRVEVRDSTNSSNVFEHTFFISAASPCIISNNKNFNLDTDQRIRLILVSSIIGQVQGTIIL